MDAADRLVYQKDREPWNRKASTGARPRIRRAPALATVLYGGETDEATTHWWVFHARPDTVHEPWFNLIEVEQAAIGNASTKATGAMERDLIDSYGQWNVLRHSGGSVVH